MKSINSYIDDSIEIEGVPTISNTMQTAGKIHKTIISKTINLSKSLKEAHTKKFAGNKFSDDNDVCGKICENARNILLIPLGSRDRDILYDLRKEIATEKIR